MSEGADEARIATRIEGAVATITIANPRRRNAFTFHMLQRIPQVFRALDEDRAVRVIVIEGDGDIAFASGDDISEFALLRSTAADEAKFMATAVAAFDAPIACGKPVVAAIEGFCFGGAMQLAAGCDIRICGEGARFSVPAVKLAVGYPLEGVARFVGLMGASQAARLFMAGRMFDCGEMLAAGFVTEKVPAGTAKAAAHAYAQELAQRAPLTLHALKRSIAACASHDPDQLARASESIAQCARSADFIEGRRAFLDKRAPVFTGT